MQMSSSASWHDAFPINAEMIFLVSPNILYLLFCVWFCVIFSTGEKDQ